MAGDFNFNPFGGDPFRVELGPGGGRRAAEGPAPYRQPLAPEDFRSAGRKALDAGVGALSYVGDTLAKPGNAVRGVLAGHGPSALKNLIPFSDSLGITDEHDHVSGRDLADQYGLTSKSDKGWGAWGVGLGTDLVTDPLTYVGGVGPKHALTDAGRAAKLAGGLKPLTGAETIAKGYGGLLKVGIPGLPGAVLGTGETAQKVARVADRVGDKLQFGNPVGRTLGALFDSRLHGATDEITQKGALAHLHPAFLESQAAERQAQHQLLQNLAPAVDRGTFPEQEITNATRALAEGSPRGVAPALAAEVGPAAAKVREIDDRRLAEGLRYGIKRDLDDPFVEHVPRQATAATPGADQFGGPAGKGVLFPTRSGAGISRKDPFRGIPGGTGFINEQFARHAGAGDAEAARLAIEDSLIKEHGAPLLTDPLARRVGKLGKTVAGADPKYLSTADQAGVPFFSPDIAGDMARAGKQHARTLAGARGGLGTIADAAQPFQPGMVPLSKMAGRLSMATTRDESGALRGGLVELHRLLEPHLGDVTPLLNGKRSSLAKALDVMGITEEHAGQIGRHYEQMQAGEPLRRPLGWLDSFGNALRGLMMPLWPAFHVRNAANAALNNATEGVGLRHYLGQLQEMTGRGGRDLAEFNPALKGLSPEAQAMKMREIKYGAAGVYGNHTQNSEVAGNVREALERGRRFTPPIPGANLSGPHGNVVADAADLALKQGLGGTLTAAGKAAAGGVAGLPDKGRRWGQSVGEHLGIRGVGGLSEDVLPGVRAGRTVGNRVEEFFRGALMNKVIEGGGSPLAAADAVDRLHFDYGNSLTGFEKNVMTRAFPIGYTFMKRNLGLQAETLLHNPGLVQQELRPFNQPDPGGKGYTPEYLQGNLVLPLGAEQDGKRQYISGLGLPIEEALGRFHTQGGGLDTERTALEFLAGLNPLVKAPLERLTDRQFYTGRKLSDLRPQGAASALGRTFGEDNPQLLAQILANSPVSRFVSSADKLTDPRKSWWQKAANLASGVKVTDVDVDKQRAIDTRRALEAVMAGHPNLSRYTSFYVKPEDAAGLTPEEVGLMRAYATQQAQGRAWAKQQRGRIGVQE